MRQQFHSPTSTTPQDEDKTLRCPDMTWPRRCAHSLTLIGRYHIVSLSSGGGVFGLYILSMSGVNMGGRREEAAGDRRTILLI